LNTINKIEILNELYSDSCSQKDFNKLVEYCWGVADSYLRVRHISLFNNKFKEIQSTKDVAIDSVTPLFVCSKNNRLSIVNAMDNWRAKLDDESDADFFLNKIIWSRAEQTVVKLLKQIDPVFEKIHKTISTCISNYGFSKVNYFGKVYILQQSEKELIGGVIPSKEFNLIPTGIFYLKQAELLNSILDYINKQTEYFPAIPFNELIHKIKFHIGQDYKYDKSSYVYSHETKIELAEILDCSFKSIEKRIVKYYSEKKLNKDEKNNLINAFKDISDDLKNGGFSGTLFEYLHNHHSGLKRDEFYRKYHNIMSYLFNIYRQDIGNHFYDDF